MTSIRPSGRGRRRGAGLAAVLAASLVAAACGPSDTADTADTADVAPSTAASAPASAPVVTAPDPVPAPPTVVATEPLPAPNGATAWRVVYATEGVAGPTVATAMVVVPTGDPPPGGWPVVVWAHPSRGLADACAPSLAGPATIPLLDDLLGEGWAVVAPDYEGLGGPGLHPYLDGASEGRSTLDALRAAPSVPGAGISAGAPVVLFGFSQGGHAALFAAELAADGGATDVRGLAVVAPVSDVAGVVDRFSRDPEQVGVVVAIVAGLSARPGGPDPARVLTPAAVAELPAADELCIDELRRRFVGDVDATLATPLAGDPAWAAALAAQEAGQDDPGVPVLVVQGDADTTVVPAETAALVDRLRGAGAEVESVVLPGGHGVDSSATVLPWLRDRLSPDPPGG